MMLNRKDYYYYYCRRWSIEVGQSIRLHTQLLSLPRGNSQTCLLGHSIARYDKLNDDAAGSIKQACLVWLVVAHCHLAHADIPQSRVVLQDTW